MRLAYLCHEPLPSASTYAEQLTATVFELARTGMAIDVLHPAARGRKPRASETVRRSLATFFGIPIDGADLDGALRFLEVPRALAGHPGQDLAATAWARRARGYDLIYTRDVLTLTLCMMVQLPTVLDTYRADLDSPRYALWRSFSYRSRSLRGVVTHSRLAAQSFLDSGLPASRVLVAYNGITLDGRTRVDSTASSRATLGLPAEARILCYAGHLGPKKGTRTLLTVAAGLPEVTFLVVGGIPDSPELEYARVTARTLGVRNVQFHPRVPPPAVAQYLQAADALIIPPTAGPLSRHRRTVLPMKTFRYLASGRPIVAPSLPDLREVLMNDRNAVLVPPDDVGAAVLAIRQLLEDGERQRRLSAAALVDAQRFSWQRRAQTIAAFLQGLV